MRTTFYIIQKEFRQLKRNRQMLPIIFVMPLIQLLVLSYAATFEIKNTNLYIVDNDHSQTSRELTAKFRGSPFFTITGSSEDYNSALRAIEQRKASQILLIPSNFERDLHNEDKAKVQVVNDAINGNAAAITNAYSASIIHDFNVNLLVETFPSVNLKDPININYSFWYNAKLDYTTYMVPGILVLLITIIGLFLSGMNIVREKEIGTIEQINVTPIHKYEFIAGKLIPFWIIALFELAFGLTIARIAFNIPMVGSIGLIFGVAAVYLIAIMGLGLFISTLANTQQQSMFLSWFFMVIFILLSGLFTPIDSIPAWAKIINIINPIHYFIPVMRNVMLKGSDFSDVSKHFWALVCYGFISISLAVWRYRKTS
ncbi:MAG: ABC transporter permease [Bacteroidota bacterium]|nr:ABC transporter permease [Bacteroidota bacterium]